MACIYTPRGLKVYTDVEDAMIYLSRVWPDYSVFSGLQLVETIFNIPSFVCFVGSICGCFFSTSIIGFIIWIVVSRIIGNLIFGFKFSAVTFTLLFRWPLTLYDILAGRGILCSIAIGVAFWFGGWQWVVAYLVSIVILYFGYLKSTSPEAAFRHAYFYMSRKCEAPDNFDITEEEKSYSLWAHCYSELCSKWPEVAQRFEYEDSFFTDLDAALSKS